MDMVINSSASAVCTIYTSIEVNPKDFIGFDDEEEIIEELRDRVRDNCYTAGEASNDQGSSTVDDVEYESIELDDITIEDFLDEWRELKNTTRDDE